MMRQTLTERSAHGLRHVDIILERVDGQTEQEDLKTDTRRQSKTSEAICGCAETHL